MGFWKPERRKLSIEGYGVWPWFTKRHTSICQLAAGQSEFAHVTSEVSDFDSTWLSAVSKKLTIQCLNSLMKQEVCLPFWKCFLTWYLRHNTLQQIDHQVPFSFNLLSASISLKTLICVSIFSVLCCLYSNVYTHIYAYIAVISQSSWIPNLLYT